MTTKEDAMQCPFCKETIIDGAIKCKHCGSMLTDDKKPGGMEKWQAFVLAPLFLAVMIIAGMVNEILSYSLVVLTSVWASFDASKIKAKNYYTAASPVTVLVGGLLLWIFTLPWYLYVRSNIKAGNYAKRETTSIKEDIQIEGDIPGFIGNDK